MNCAIIGCGYVADFYMFSLKNHPELNIIGVFDRDLNRAKNFAKAFGVYCFNNFQEVLSSADIDIVINLTNICSHYEVSKAAILSGKHIYSEKPVASSLSEAAELVELAKERQLKFFVAPCNLYSPSIQTIHEIITNEEVGSINLVYAELDNGPIHMMDYTAWKSSTGCPWPYKEEFSSGCVQEHAGYHLPWLVDFFGPVTEVISYSSSSLINEREGKDFSVSCLKFSSGVEARLTYSIVAPVNRSTTFVGKNGIIHLQDCWDYNSPIFIQKYAKKHVGSGRFHLALSPQKTVPLKMPFNKCYEDTHNMDFCLGISYLRRAIKEEDFVSCLSVEYGYHFLEVIYAMENLGRSNINSATMLHRR